MAEETTPVSTPEAGAPTAPEHVASTPDVGGGAPAVDATPAPTPPNPRAEIESFASGLGFDPAEFASYQTVDDAKAAVKQFVTHSMKSAEGFDPNAPAAPAVPAPPQQPFTPPAPPMEQPPALDFSALDLDPESAAAKVISGMSAKLSQVEQTNKAILDQIQNAQRQQQVASYQARRSEADSVVDSFSSPHFGTAAHRNFIQARNVEALYDVSDAIAISRGQAGQSVPPLKQRLAMAKLYFDQEMGGIFPAANGAAAAAPVLRESAPAPAVAPGAPSLAEKWSQNPQVRAALGI